MFNIICICFAIIGLSFLIADMVIVRKNRKLLNELEAMRDWCAKYDRTPEDYVNQLKEIAIVINNSTKESK